MENNMKETLEAAAEKHIEKNSLYFDTPYEKNHSRVAFIEGAKWQQKELEKELNRFFLYLRNSGEHFIGVPNEQFVKKYLKSR
jgi:hypothetical protein